MPVVEISFDTYKHLTLRREDETVTYDEGVRRFTEQTSPIRNHGLSRTSKEGLD